MDLRASIPCLALPFGRVLPTPDSTIDQKARQQMALCYTEILAAGASATRTYHYAESNGESTTTSTSPQDKTTLTFTPDASSTYYILAAYQLAASGAASRVESKFINDTAATTLSQCTSESTHSSDYFSIAGASIEAFGGSPASQTYKVQYNSTNASWSAKVQNARIIALKKISGDENAESLAEQTNTTATLADACTLTFTPASNGRYLIIATCDTKTAGTGEICRVALDINGTEWARTDIDSNGTGDRRTWGAAIPADLTSGGSRTIKIQFSRVVSGTAYVYNCRIIALRLDTFTAAYDGTNQTGATTTSSTYQDFITEANTVNAADHLTIASSVLSASSQVTTSPTGRLLNHDGSTADVETLFRSRQSFRVQSAPLFTFRKETLTSGSKTWKIQYKSPNNSNTVGCDEGAIAVLQLDTSSGSTYNESLSFAVSSSLSDSSGAIFGAAMSLATSTAMDDSGSSLIGAAMSLGAAVAHLSESHAAYQASASLGASVTVSALSEAVLEAAAALGVSAALQSSLENIFTEQLAFGLIAGKESAAQAILANAISFATNQDLLAAIAGNELFDSLSLDVAAGVAGAAEKRMELALLIALQTGLVSESQLSAAATLALGMLSGYQTAAQGILSGSITLAASGSISASTFSQIIASVLRTYRVSAEARVFRPGAEDRTYNVN